MMDSGKKISFGFNKSNKKPTIFNKPVEHTVELVECLEERSIKIKDAIEVINEPLVIPIKDNKKNLLSRVKEAKTNQKDLTKVSSKQEDDLRPDSELTTVELAARELMRDVHHRSNKVSDNILILPVEEDKITLEGDNEPTLDDYENVPVSQYGMAMLRGMGWKEGMGIGKNPTKSASRDEPELRPKGLGLGANRMVKAEISNKIACDNEGNALILKKGTYAKIIAGSHKGNYCEVQGLDDEAGRAIVRTSLKGEILTLNEFLIVPVTKEEYSKESRILNSAKYEKYKEISDKKLENHWKKNNDNTSRYKEEIAKGNDSNKHFKDNQSLQVEVEKPTRSSDYYKEDYLTPKEVSRRFSSKSEKYQKIDKFSKDTYKDKYENRNRYSHRDKSEKYSSESDSDCEKKYRKDKERKKYYHGESSRGAHEDKHKNDRKNSESKHRSRSSSCDGEEQMYRKNKMSGHHKHDSSERMKTSRKTRR